MTGIPTDGFAFFERPLVHVSADGLTRTSFRGVLRGLRIEQQVGGADQAVGELVVLYRELEAEGLLPLAKYDRIESDGRQFTLEDPMTHYSGIVPVTVKATVKG